MGWGSCNPCFGLGGKKSGALCEDGDEDFLFFIFFLPIWEWDIWREKLNKDGWIKNII